jgi:hypothetical protein
MDCGRRLDFNDPSLLESKAAGPEDEASASLSPHARRFSLEKSDVLGKMIFLFAMFIVFLGVFFVLQTSHVPEKELSLAAARNLDRKLSRLESADQSVYAALNGDEVNIFIERRLAPHREALSAMKPDFLRFQKAFVQLERYGLSLHLKYHLFKRPFFFTLEGTIQIREGKFDLDCHRFSAGKLRLPVRLLSTVFGKEAPYLDENAVFEAPEGVASVKINRKILSAFSSGNAKAPGSAAPGSPGSPDRKLPDDVLLIQAADHCFDRKRFARARKYYSLALIRFPNSPLKNHASTRLKSCTPNP